MCERVSGISAWFGPSSDREEGCFLAGANPALPNRIGRSGVHNAFFTSHAKKKRQYSNIVR